MNSANRAQYHFKKIIIQHAKHKVSTCMYYLSLVPRPYFNIKVRETKKGLVAMDKVFGCMR